MTLPRRKAPMPSQIKRILLGDPLANEQAAHQRLSNFVALPVFASDALSSVAYATEEILLVLILAGTAALTLSLPIALAIAALIVVVVLSYRQTIRAYPSGGGSYIVAKENLGANAGLVAGASLLVDYILTVAVSISAGTAAITSAFPQLLQVHGADRRRARHRARLREPARRARVGGGVRRAHVLLRRDARPAHRRRPVQAAHRRAPSRCPRRASGPSRR